MFVLKRVNTMRFFILTLILGCFVVAKAQTIKTFISDPKMISYKSKVTYFLNNQVDDIELAHFKATFDDRGNKIEETKMDSLGNVLRIFRFRYNSADKMVWQGEYTKEGMLVDENTYVYDNNGRLASQGVYQADSSLKWRWEYKYDKKGQNKEVVSYDKDNKVIWKRKYKYDDAGHLTTEIWQKSFRKLNWKWVYDYNYAGRLSECNEYKIDGTYMGRVKYNYNDNFILTEQIRYNSKGSLIFKKEIFDIVLK